MKWPSLLSREGDDRLLRTQQETNDLLRELIRAITGRQAVTRPMLETKPRVRDASDISVVTRKTVTDLETLAHEKEIAPWRAPSNGPASAPPSPKSGALTSSPEVARIWL